MGKLLPGTPDDLCYRKSAWSPDGKYVLYFVGGDIHRSGSDLRSFVYSVNNGRKIAVAEGPGVDDSVWTGKSTLLFSRQKLERIKDRAAWGQTPVKDEGILQTRSAIYESTIGSPPVMVLSDAMKPVPSPDGMWIAFYGVPESTPREERDDAALKAKLYERNPLLRGVPSFQKSPPVLSVSNRKARKRWPLYPLEYQNRLGQKIILWTGGSARLTILNSEQSSELVELQISSFDLATKNWRQDLKLKSRDYTPISFSPWSPKFIVLNKDSFDSFLLETVEFREEDKPAHQAIQRIDLTKSEALDLMLLYGCSATVQAD